MPSKAKRRIRCRHKCVLVIFSDIDTVDYKSKGMFKREGRDTYRRDVVQKARMLKNVHKSLVDAGRVAVVECRPNKRKGEGKAKDEAAKYTKYASGTE
jgi:hypothetical protein